MRANSEFGIRNSEHGIQATIGIVILALAAYANSLGNGFVWDDPIILERQLVVFRSIGDIIVPPAGIPQFSPDYYRPVVIASYLLDRAIGGRIPFVYHCSVVFAHAVAAGLVVVLATRLFGPRPGATFGALAAGALFAVHPVHTESVAWMAGRSDVLATAFTLAALLAHGGKRRPLLTGLLVLLALCSKETAVTVFPLLALQDWVKPRSPRDASRRTRDLLIRYAGPATAGAVYAVARQLALVEFVGRAAVEPEMQRSALEVAGAVALYLGRLVAPMRLSAYIDSVPTDWMTLGVTAAAILVVAGAGMTMLRRGERLPAFLIAWVALTLLPSLAIVWKIPEAPVAERYLYLPSAGYCLLLGYIAMRAWASNRLPHARAVAAVSLAILVAAGLTTTAARNRVWHDNLALWSDAAAKSRIAGMPLRGLAAELQKRGRLDEARSHFEQALARKNSRSGHLIILNNLGTLAMQQGDYEEAERYYRQALEVEANAPDTLFNLGLAIFERGGREHEAAREALTLYQRAAVLSPHDPDIEAALGQVLASLGEREEAARHMRRALDLGVRAETAASIRVYLQRIERSP